MRPWITRSLLVAFALLAAGKGEAQTTDTDIGGDWSFRFVGGKGAAVLHFSVPSFGGFQAQGHGYTTLFPQQAFGLDTAPAQTLSFDSVRDIHGVLALREAVTKAPIGQLTVQHGSYSAKSDRVSLRGTMTVAEGGGAPVTKKVSLVGTRLAPPETSQTGRSFDGLLSGKRCRSAKYDIQVYDESTMFSSMGVAPIVYEGYPFFYLRAGGPARVDGVEVASSIEGLIVADATGKVFGRVSTSDFGPAILTGSIVAGAKSVDGAPVFKVAISSDTKRHAKLTGVLN